MPKKADELGPLAVSRLKKPGRHPVGGVAGLRLQISKSGARSWILIATVGGKRREMGLGGYPDVTLAGARDAARAARALIASGVDPIAEAKAARSALQAAGASVLTFNECAEKYIRAHESEWKNPKHIAQWRSTLETYAGPVLGKLNVADIELPHVLGVLEPIWKTKTETASRVRGRIESVLDWAKVRGYRTGPNPAQWKGHLDHVLPAPGKVQKPEHHRALPIDEMPSFMGHLRKAEGLGALALEFAILTAARSGEVRGAAWGEIDLEARTWTVPAARMKAGIAHEVPLSEPAARLLKSLPRIAGSEFVFPAPRGGQLSDMTLSGVMRRMKVAAVPHGFRSTFRDWCAERTNFPRDVAEHALAHQLPDKTAAAYQRSTLFVKRRAMMEEWGAFCERVQVVAKVTPIQRKAAPAKVAR